MAYWATMDWSGETIEKNIKSSVGHKSGDTSGTGRSDLLEFCFPASAPASDEIRRLAYANSICLLFVILAFVGIKAPVFVIGAAVPQTEELIPVIFEPPPVQQNFTEPQTHPELIEPNVEPLQEMPMVVPVLVSDPSQAAFAVPVEGPVILTPVKHAAPPPRVLPPPALALNSGSPQATEFRSGTQDGGVYPEPDYPRTALQRRMEGRVMLYVVVNPNGSPRSVNVRDSSGWSLLDNHALEFVKRRWHWPAGEERHYIVPFRFQISKN